MFVKHKRLSNLYFLGVPIASPYDGLYHKIFKFLDTVKTVEMWDKTNASITCFVNEEDEVAYTISASRSYITARVNIKYNEIFEDYDIINKSNLETNLMGLYVLLNKGFKVDDFMVYDDFDYQYYTDFNDIKEMYRKGDYTIL